MDWFKSSLQAAQKQAQEAAEKAKALAQQASQQALVLAGQASEQAKVFAEQATEKAKQASEKAKVLASAAAEEAQAKLQQLAAVSSQAAVASTSATDADPAELAKYGITTGLLETISGMTYSTFSDYPIEELAFTNPLGLSPPIPAPGFRLNAWQERHALLMLSRGDQLQGLRFALCPKRMSEELFWIIYFTLVKTLLPPEAFKPPSAEDQAAAVGTSAPASSSAGAGSVGPSTEARTAVGASTTPASESLTTLTSSSRRLSAAAVPTTTTSITTAASPTASRTTATATPAGGAGGRSSSTGDEGVLVDVGSSSNVEEEGEEDADEDGEGEGEGGDGDLDALEDDPELAAYLQDALDVAEGDDGEGLSDLGSATDDLDDYINQLDAELGAGGSGEGEGASPTKAHTDDV